MSMSKISGDFKTINLIPALIEQCAVMGITKPTPVQAYCIPKILAGEHCIGVSETGSGKTFAFALPILQLLDEDPYGIFALVLTPTRELANQIADQFKDIGKPMNLQVSVVIGGMNMVNQAIQLVNKPNIVVATPGRLADHLNSSPDISLKRLRILVLDEADRLLDGQFTDQLETIFDSLPSKRQCLLFSATMPKYLEEVKKIGIIEPFIWQSDCEVQTIKELTQKFILVPHTMNRNASLVHFINNFQGKRPKSSIIVFTKNCKQCQMVSLALRNLGFKNVALNSHLKQRERNSSISEFKSNRIKLLIATDVASRGLDIRTVDLVMNYNVPIVPKKYIHRVGRTARSGKKGLAITILTQREIDALQRIENETNYRMTEHKISDKKILKILSEVKVAFRKANISLEDTEVDQRKRLYKMKDAALKGDCPEKTKKSKYLRNMVSKKKSRNSMIKENAGKGQ